MIIYKCDICRKQVSQIDSIVLYKTKLDYCENCKTKSNKIQKAVLKSIRYYNSEADKQITDAEKNILKKFLST
jgi:hypothetical protein